MLLDSYFEINFLFWKFSAEATDSGGQWEVAIP